MARNRKKQQPTGKAKSFTISNSIEKIPTSNNKVIKKKGFRIVGRGSDNLLPYTIDSIIKGSVTLSSIISSKAEYVSYGTITGLGPKTETKLTKDLNADYQIYELLKRVDKDYNSFGYAFIEEVVTKGQSFIYHLPNIQVCISEYEDTPESVVISKDWRDNKKEQIEVALYPEYTEFEGEKRRVFMICDYDISSRVYPLPDWVASYYDAQVESLIGQYNANQFENGITLSSILMFDFGDVPVLEDGGTENSYFSSQRKKLERQLKGTSGGNNGKSLIVPINGSVEKPEYLTYPMEKEGSFEKLQQTIENNIVRASKWFRSLSGLATAGTLGNNQQLRNEWNLAERMIKNAQFKYLDAVFKLLEIEEDYDISNESPISYSDKLEPMSILTLNEKRTALGYETIEGSKENVALNGAQVTSLVEVVKAFALGELTESQATQIIKIALGITEEEAKKLLI